MRERRRPTPLRLDQDDYDRVEAIAEAATRGNVSDVLRALIREALDAREGVSHRVSHSTRRVSHSGVSAIHEPSRELNTEPVSDVFPDDDPPPEPVRRAPSKPMSKVEAMRRMRERAYE